MHDAPPVLLGVEVLLGSTKEVWLSVSLRHLEGLLCRLWEEALKVRQGPLRLGSFSAHSVEDGFCGRDAVCFCRVLLLSLSLLPLSLWDLSWCLDEGLCESFSCISWHSLDGGEHLLQCEDFLLDESMNVFGDGAWRDSPLDLGGSPSLLVELGTSSEVWEN